MDDEEAIVNLLVGWLLPQTAHEKAQFSIMTARIVDTLGQLVVFESAL